MISDINPDDDDFDVAFEEIKQPYQMKTSNNAEDVIL